VNDHKTTGIRCSMAAAFLLMTCAGASAQAVTEDAWTLTPFLGVVFGGNVENAPATGGVALGYGGRGLGVEGDLAYFKAEQGVLSQFDTAVWLYGLNVLWQFAPRGSAIPYALGGIAWQRTSADLEGIPGTVAVEDGATASFTFGGGLKAMLAERAGIRLDLRYVNGRDLAPDFWRLYGGVTWKFGLR
jgi:opacity protein-like surface antigen